MSVGDIMNMTLRRFHRIMDEYKSVQEREDQRHAVLCAVVANGYSRKPVKPEDFLAVKKKQTPEQMAQEFMRATGYTRR